MTDIISKLQAAIPGVQLISPGEKAAAYEKDESGMGSFAPDAVVIARDVADVQAVMRFANEHRVPVVPRGGGSGKSGGALAVEGGIVLSLEKLNRILEVSRCADMVAVVEPGVDPRDAAGRGGRRRGSSIRPIPTRRPGARWAEISRTTPVARARSNTGSRATTCLVSRR